MQLQREQATRPPSHYPGEPRHFDQRAPSSDTRSRVASAPREMELSALMRRCTAASEDFFQGQPTDTRFAYELFRRALAERDEWAWEYLYNHYYRLVEHWVRRNATFVTSGESCEFFVSAAFIRLWQAVSPERFADFPTLVSLLYYLRRCAECAVIDGSRSYRMADDLQEMGTYHTAVYQRPPDEEIIERMSREEFWRYINAQLHDEAERVVMLYSYVVGLKPADIHECRRDLFASVNDVYVVKRRVLVRLRRRKELHCLLG